MKAVYVLFNNIGLPDGTQVRLVTHNAPAWMTVCTKRICFKVTDPNLLRSERAHFFREFKCV